MGLRPTRGNENRSCRPRESGDPFLDHNGFPLTRELRTPGVIFRGAAGDEEPRTAVKVLRARFLAALGMTV